MNDTKIFSQVFDLKFALCATIKVKLVFQCSTRLLHITIPRFGRLLALMPDRELAVPCFFKKQFRNFNQVHSANISGSHCPRTPTALPISETFSSHLSKKNSRLQHIERAFRTIAQIANHMRIDHCGLHAFMAKQFLHLSNIHPLHQQMGGKTVA